MRRLSRAQKEFYSEIHWLAAEANSPEKDYLTPPPPGFKMTRREKRITHNMSATDLAEAYIMMIEEHYPWLIREDWCKEHIKECLQQIERGE